MNKILVATDFTPAAKNALDFACMLAQKSEDVITLFHVENSYTKSLLQDAGKKESDLDSYLGELSQFASEEFDVVCEYKTRKGSIFSDITDLAGNGDYKLIVMGTHGTKGIRQSIFGADILKIARKAPVPVIALPDKSNLNDFFDKIVFPYGGHRDFQNKTKAAAMIAELFNSEIHIYSVDREGMTISKETRENISKAQEYFDSRGVKYSNVHEKMEDFSIGFAHQTMQYALKIGAKIIAVMATSSREFSFISDVDKEALINNQEGLAILLTSDN